MTVNIHLRKSSARNSSRVLRWSASLLLFLAGITALGYCGYVVYDAWLFQRNELKEFDQSLSDVHAAAADNRDAHSAPAANISATSPVMPAFTAATDRESIPSAAIPDVDFPLGKIEIPALRLTAMIQEGTGQRSLRRGIGHIEGTSPLGQSGNIGLAGHRDTFFRKLREIHNGDQITITTLTGSFLYRVDLISIVEPRDSEVLRDSGGDSVTLVTCYPFSFIGPAPKRFIVHASKMDLPNSETTSRGASLH